MNKCLSCSLILNKKIGIYCSNQCQSDYLYNKYITDWKRGLNSGSRGILTMNISEHIKRYVYDKFGHKCSLCSWKEINPTTLKVPLEIDHIDGDYKNNTESNLRLICPNCHSLTSSYRNLNIGSGREWRRLKYIKS